MSRNRLARRRQNRGTAIRLPEWMFPDGKAAFEKFVEWKLEPHWGSHNTWVVHLSETIHGNVPELVAVTPLANIRNAHLQGAYSRINRLKPFDKYVRSELSAMANERHLYLADRYPSELFAMLHSIRYLTMGAPDSHRLAIVVQECMMDLLLPKATGATAHLIEVSKVLHTRYTVVRALLQRDSLVVDPTDNVPQFKSAIELLGDTILGLSAYLEPLFTSLAPNPWGMTASRPGGVIAYLFGTALPGAAIEPNDLMQLSAPDRGRREKLPSEPSSSHDYVLTLNWWMRQLNLLFSVITDPLLHEVSGEFDPERAFERHFAMEHLFRSCQALAAHHSDPFTRRLLLFQVLEMLSGLDSSLRWEQLASPKFAKDTLADIEKELPASVSTILLPRARAAAMALAKLREGFFMSLADDGSSIFLPDKHGGFVLTDLDRAVTQWLRVVRNSHHGFDKTPSPRERALLRSHTGAIDDALSDLAWLYLLRIMTHPERLLVRSGKRHLESRPATG